MGDSLDIGAAPQRDVRAGDVDGGGGVEVVSRLRRFERRDSLGRLADERVQDRQLALERAPLGAEPQRGPGGDW